MRTVLLVLVSLVCASGAAAAGGASDKALARSLVVTHTQVPDSWDATVVPNPCPLVARRGSTTVARAATRWGSLNRGIWSVATVTAGPSETRALFARVARELPACVVRSLRTAFSPRPARVPSVRLTRRSVPALGEARIAWHAAVRHRLDGRPARFELDVVLVRTGRAVAFYLCTWVDGLPTIERILARAG